MMHKIFKLFTEILKCKLFKINLQTLQIKFWFFNWEHEFGPNYEIALNK